jgi:hypothetical protein
MSSHGYPRGPPPLPDLKADAAPLPIVRPHTPVDVTYPLCSGFKNELCHAFQQATLPAHELRRYAGSQVSVPQRCGGIAGAPSFYAGVPTELGAVSRVPSNVQNLDRVWRDLLMFIHYPPLGRDVLGKVMWTVVFG